MAGRSLGACPHPSEGSEPPHRVQKRKTSMDENLLLASKRPQLARSTTASISLCERCQAIKWAKFTEPPAAKKGRRVLNLPYLNRRRLGDSSCPICQLIAQVVPRDLDGKHCQLQALSSSRTILGRELCASQRNEGHHCTVLFPVLKSKSDDGTEGQHIENDWREAGCLALLEAGHQDKLLETKPRPLSPLINFSLIKRWLKYCEEHHRKTCSMTGDSNGNVPGLRVIDCESEKTIDAPANCTYVALSYVWGKPAEPPSLEDIQNPRDSTVEFPKVISDALEVTRLLGKRYLWVDKYCIEQKPGPLKTKQVGQMHEIYSCACVTLVAAAGEDSSYGIPGIGAKQRLPMEHLEVDDVSIIRMFPHTSTQIFQSVWASRGWTYQEGFLSPRRLIFTDHEVSYLCNAMHHTETVRKPLPLPETEIERDIASFLEIMPSVPSLYGSKDEHWRQLKQKQLPNFTRRQLTEKSDSIKAVLGLLRSLESSGIRHIYGIPVRRVSTSPSDRVAFCLAWHHEATAERYHEFPSWSWSGWIGGICMREPDVFYSGDHQIELMEEDYHTTLSLQDWFSEQMQKSDPTGTSAPRVLHISAMTIRIRLENKSWDGLNKMHSVQSQLAGMSYMDGIHAVLPIREDVTALAYAYMDENVSLDAEILGLILQAESRKSRYTILLLRHDKDHYQRVGLIGVSSCDMTRPTAPENSDPQTVYVDKGGAPIDRFTRDDKPPLWVQTAVRRAVSIK
ncbi:hypothetical protein FSARC_6118 [Fusarium sarcochroum]|uniref:Heterokaryon incompatibility domain-containing protein n=1 Tax=Fusarium sarcochroum TaxID=1208366 RepID=A0A8H4TYD7_9HYPO|nr:hypothetical protein FSARC_6118 [Fusarium sarcochroum]